MWMVDGGEKNAILKRHGLGIGARNLVPEDCMV